MQILGEVWPMSFENFGHSLFADSGPSSLAGGIDLFHWHTLAISPPLRGK